MKIGIITDIHNNIIALKSVLKEFSHLEINHIICSGDIIGIGPRPEETVTAMMELENLIACVRGNHESYYLEGLPSTVPNNEHMGWGEMDHHKWEHSLLSEKSKSFLEHLPHSTFLEIEGVTIYIAHYSLNTENKCTNYTSNPTAQDLKSMFFNIEADVIIYGHDHNCSIVPTEDKFFINCGALGCPGKDKNIARAGVLEIHQGSVDFKLLQVQYDVESVIEDIRLIKYPEYDTILKYFYNVSL